MASLTGKQTNAQTHGRGGDTARHRTRHAQTAHHANGKARTRAREGVRLATRCSGRALPARRCGKQCINYTITLCGACLLL